MSSRTKINSDFFVAYSHSFFDKEK